MKRLCFYCFWITDRSRLIRRPVAKEYYLLSDHELLSVPFFASNGPVLTSLMEDSSKGMFERIGKITLNDLAPEVLVKEKAMKVHGSLEQMRKTRNLEFKESQRLHWRVYILLFYSEF